MTNLKLNLAWIFLVALMGCKAPSNSTAAPTPTPIDVAPYAGHLVYVAVSGNVWTYIPDERTGELKTSQGGPIGHLAENCMLVMSPKKTYLLAACNQTQVFTQFKIESTGRFVDSDIQYLNPAGVSTNYNSDGMAFDSSGNLFVHYTENITPYTEKTAQFSFNESTDTYSFVGYVSSAPTMSFSQSATVDDLTYFLNTTSDRVDMEQDGSLTSYSTFMSSTPVSIVAY